MPDTWVVFRAVVPPGFNVERYAEQSSEPIRFDVVTVVEAESPQEAVNTVISATGIVGTGFAACRVDLVGFGSKAKVSRGGVLQAAEPHDDDEGLRRIRQLESEIDRLKEIGNE